jgi:hypothetical protein
MGRLHEVDGRMRNNVYPRKREYWKEGLHEEDGRM